MGKERKYCNLGIGLIPPIATFILGIAVIKVYNFLTKENILENYVEKLISKNRFKELPNLIKGKTGYANNLGVKIFYEDLCLSDNPISTVLLINGSSETLIQWPEKMVRTILKNNFRIIRFDNRGLGMSDWMKKPMSVGSDSSSLEYESTDVDYESQISGDCLLPSLIAVPDAPNPFPARCGAAKALGQWGGDVTGQSGLSGPQGVHSTLYVQVMIPWSSA